MTQNAWNTDQLNANGEVLIGSGTGRPTATTLTGGTNCTIVNGANTSQITYSGSSSGDMVLTHSASASNSAELTFTGLSSTYFCYMVVVDNYVPAVDNNRLYFQTSTDNGSSYDSGSSDYYYRGWESEGGTVGALDGEFDKSNITGSGTYQPGNATNESGSAISFFWNPSASDYLRVTNFNAQIDDTGALALLSIHSGRIQATAVNAFRMFCSGGNITTAEVRVYGMVAS